MATTAGAGAADDAVATDFFFYVSQQNSSGNLDRKLTGFVANLKATCELPSFKAEFVTFQHHIRLALAGAALVDSPAWRGLLRLSLPTAMTPDTKILEDNGNGNGVDHRVAHGPYDIVLYPPYQFATQVLLGGILNLRHPDTGLAFAETVKSHVLPVNFNVSFEEFMKVASSHLRNVFAHSTEPYFLGQNSLYKASKKWCFSGTPLLEEPASPFWENRDILSYIFTATPYAFWIPLCYQRACVIMKQRKSGAFCSAVTQVSDNGFIQLAENLPPAVRQHEYIVIFDVEFGSTLKAGVSYHVMKSSSSHPTPSFRVSRTRSSAHPIEISAASFDDPHSARPIATFQKCSNILKDAAILECMPAAQMATEMPSLLDSYFDYDMSLAELMSQLGDGCKDAELFEDPKVSKKKHLHENTDFRSRFASLREKFNNRICLLSEFYKLQCRGDVNPRSDVAIWCKSYHIVSDILDEMFFVDFSISSSNWLGLSKVEAVVNFVAGKRHRLHVRIPKAVKTQPCPPDRLAEFEKIMATLKTGSHVASATKQMCWEFAVDPLVPDDSSPAAVPASPKSHRTPRAQEFYEQRTREYWLSEAGICTVEELFGDGVLAAERETLAFRDLMRHVRKIPCISAGQFQAYALTLFSPLQIFQSMALGVSHLHECGISHNGISAKYFKVSSPSTSRPRLLLSSH
jgi:hypothetical protein